MSLISVIIPAYNRSEHLKVAAFSVLNQTYTNLELIVVDDGSTDETRVVSDQLCHLDSRVRYLYQDNRGPSAARNRGITAAQGLFVAFLDSDDRWEPTKLEIQLPLIEAGNNIGIVSCGWAVVDEDGHVAPGVNPPNLNLPTMYESLLYDNVVEGSASSVLIRKECFDRAGLFDESLRWTEDWDMWWRLAEYYEFAHTSKVLVYLLEHMHQSQKSVEGVADAYMKRVEKITRAISPPHRHHLPQVRWHNQLFAAELYCSARRNHRAWRAVVLAIQSWPHGLLSPRTWYVLILTLSGPFYPYASRIGLIVRRWYRLRFAVDSITGWRNHAA